MKKKTRNINVKGIDFVWNVNVSDDEYLILKIWLNQKVLRETLVSYDTQVTPKYVEEFIKKSVFHDG
jgi:predicted metal-binding transcription factor (methanogenesis marker protein 9)